MDISPRALIKLLVPRLPLLLTTAILNTISLSPNSSKQDLQTEVTVVILRSILNVRKTMGYLQHISLNDPGIKGPVSIAKVTIPPPIDEAGPRDAIVRAIKELGDGSETYTLPDIVSVQAEWTGYRKGVAKNEPRPDLPEADQYRVLMAGVSNETTILYFHGGAYFLMDPCSHRQPVAHLARLTGGRGYSVRYRLAPQNPFPAQLLDGLIAYLSLLSPPDGSFHEPVPAKSIVFAGDSAGGNLAVALLQLLLTLQRIGLPTIKFHGVDVSIELPAGVALNSCWADISRSMPSINKNAQFDYLDPPTAEGISKSDPLPDDLWPARPPRAEIFCNASMVAHPLVSPLAAHSELWKGMPPAWLCLGNEGLEDEITILARRMHQGGGVVHFVGYEGMPHCFAMIFPTSPKGKDCYQRQAKFIMDVVGDAGPTSSEAIWIKAFSNPPEPNELDFEHLSKLTDDEVCSAIETMRNHAMRREQEALKKWNELQSRAKL
ncbi:putative lipase/esterase [Cladophialophora carrionii]|uniref:Putative lipase/esterase n=1 Tax=Cladophialophora carrionii TaxID=86049 RepID=A0A1C1CKG5_9EURO|nr:putative lipase/esterase [Cladophialophora carrionii]